MGVLAVELHFPGNASLKDKRMSLRSIRSHLVRDHGATVAEVGYQDLWQRSGLVLAVAASDATRLDHALDAVQAYLEGQDWEVTRVQREVYEVDV